MRKLVLIIAVLWFASCSVVPDTVSDNNENNNIAIECHSSKSAGTLVPIAILTPTNTVTKNLLAGKNRDCGELVLSLSNEYLVVTYILDGPWKLGADHLAIAKSLDGIPQTRSGNPKIGHFPYKHYVHRLATDKFVIALSELHLVSGDIFLTAAQAEIGKLIKRKDSHHRCSGNDHDYEYGCCESAWAEGNRFPGHDWAMYFPVQLILFGSSSSEVSSSSSIEVSSSSVSSEDTSSSSESSSSSSSLDGGTPE